MRPVRTGTLQIIFGIPSHVIMRGSVRIVSLTVETAISRRCTHNLKDLRRLTREPAGDFSSIIELGAASRWRVDYRPCYKLSPRGQHGVSLTTSRYITV